MTDVDRDGNRLRFFLVCLGVFFLLALLLSWIRGD